MSHSEPQQPCPKCGQLQAQSQMFSHYISCRSNKYLESQSFSYPNQALNQNPLPPNPSPNPQLFYQPIYQAPPPHKHSWIENDSYKWCLECRALSLKLRGTWFLFLRYGLKLIWIIFLLDLVLALGLVSYFHISR